jgi:hypothetical protein
MVKQLPDSRICASAVGGSFHSSRGENQRIDLQNAKDVTHRVSSMALSFTRHESVS